MDNKKEMPSLGTSKDPVSYPSFPRVCVISITVVTIKEFIERVLLTFPALSVTDIVQSE